MSYYDTNGLITIDEEAAEQDVRRIQEAKIILEEALDRLKTMMNIAESFQGETAKAIIEKCDSLSKRIEELVRNLDNTTDYIRSLVEQYYQLDLEWKQIIESTTINAEGDLNAQN